MTNKKTNQEINKITMKITIIVILTIFTIIFPILLLLDGYLIYKAFKKNKNKIKLEIMIPNNPKALENQKSRKKTILISIISFVVIVLAYAIYDMNTPEYKAKMLKEKQQQQLETKKEAADKKAKALKLASAQKAKVAKIEADKKAKAEKIEADKKAKEEAEKEKAQKQEQAYQEAKHKQEEKQQEQQQQQEEIQQSQSTKTTPNDVPENVIGAHFIDTAKGKRCVIQNHSGFVKNSICSKANNQ